MIIWTRFSNEYGTPTFTISKLNKYIQSENKINKTEAHKATFFCPKWKKKLLRIIVRCWRELFWYSDTSSEHQAWYSFSSMRGMSRPNKILQISFFFNFFFFKIFLDTHIKLTSVDQLIACHKHINHLIAFVGAFLWCLSFCLGGDSSIGQYGGRLLDWSLFCYN